ncbi:MAG: methylenetetrahydrofolate reductase, partial [Lawsonibacter sp.]|nr:methylenetetrahydrofolate reductase [Lawsonibacter sp.]
MKLCELFGRGRTVFSCEVFPPKKSDPVDSIYKTLDGLKDIRPDFISVTFGAGGSQVNQTTREIAALIENQYHIPAMAHLTCVDACREDVDRLLADQKADGVE